VYRSIEDCQFALGHNGNLVNTEQLAAELGALPGTLTSDTDLMAEMLAAELHVEDSAGAEDPGDRLDRALERVLPRLEGAFSLVLMDAERIIGVRDPNGLRPLCLGRLDDGWVLASESPALDIVGAKFDREIEPGEVVIIGRDGPRSLWPFPPERIKPTLCLFEFVYFARPDSQLYGQSVHHARVRQGELLAAQAPLPESTPYPDAEGMVMGVPESGVPAAEGYARASGIPFGQGLVKNRYIGRTFIAPSQEMRALGVRMKFNPLKENIAGRRLVVVDDSIVRGTTQKQLVKMLREAGALEVHLRLTSPPVRWPCFYGMDFGDTKQLLAANLDVEGIRKYLAVDTLSYIELDRLLTSTGADPDSFCSACFTGEYPLPIPVDLGKGMLETGGLLAIDRDSSRSANAVMFEASLLPADEVRRDAQPPEPGPGGPVEI
jgi:amidophosphoribosyltransferase